jgi:hypothetical protein
VASWGSCSFWELCGEWALLGSGLVEAKDHTPQQPAVGTTLLFIGRQTWHPRVLTLGSSFPWLALWRKQAASPGPQGVAL